MAPSERPPTPRDGLRVGDRERDEVTAALHDAFVQGRITREELDERLGATLAARTEGDLRQVTADLPGAHGFTGPPAGGYGFPAPWAGGRGPGLGPWSHRAAEARRRGGYPRRRGGPPPTALLVLSALVAVSLVSGAMWPLIAAFKLFFFAWMAMALLGLVHHRRFHRRPRHGGRIGP